MNSAIINFGMGKASLFEKEVRKVRLVYMVRVTGVEPAHRKIPDPKSGASTNSAIPANISGSSSF